METDWNYRHLMSVLAMAVTFAAYLPYIYGIVRGRTRPHVFSWVIWGITTTIVFLVQLAERSGPGGWSIGVSGAVTILIAVLAFLYRSDNSITRLDWLFFLAALSSLPFWYFTSSPLTAVIILTTVDVLGFGPTLRKVWSQPYTEQPGFFSLFMLQYILVIAALETWSLTTLLFPAAMVTSCLCVVVLILYRRHLVTK